MIKTQSKLKLPKPESKSFTFSTNDYRVSIPGDRVLSNDEMILLTQMVDNAFLLKKIEQNKPIKKVLRIEFDENTILGSFNVILAAIVLISIMNLFSAAIKNSPSVQSKTYISEIK